MEDVALLFHLTRIGVLLVALGTLLVLGFGLWLVHLGRFGYDAGWIDAALGLLVATVILGAFGGQRPKQARQLAIKRTSSAQASPELRALLDDRTARALNYLPVLLLLVIIALMVFKPGATHS